MLQRLLVVVQLVKQFCLAVADSCHLQLGCRPFILAKALLQPIRLAHHVHTRKRCTAIDGQLHHLTPGAYQPFTHRRGLGLVKALLQHAPGFQRRIKLASTRLRPALGKQRLRQPMPVLRGRALQMLCQRIGRLRLLLAQTLCTQSLQTLKPGCHQMLFEALICAGKWCGQWQQTVNHRLVLVKARRCGAGICHGAR